MESKAIYVRIPLRPDISNLCRSPGASERLLSSNSGSVSETRSSLKSAILTPSQRILEVPTRPTQDAKGRWIEHTILGDVAEYEEMLKQMGGIASREKAKEGEAAKEEVEVEEEEEEVEEGGQARRAKGETTMPSTAQKPEELTMSQARTGVGEDILEGDYPDEVAEMVRTVPESAHLIKEAYQERKRHCQGLAAEVERIRTERNNVKLSKELERFIWLRIAAGKQTNSLVNWEEKNAEWMKTKDHLQAATQKAESELAMERADFHRAKMEELDMFDVAVPPEARHADDTLWEMSLRGCWSKYIQVGNIFSSLFTNMEDGTREHVERIGRPDLDIVSSLANSHAGQHGKGMRRNWFDVEFLRERREKYYSIIKQSEPHKPILDHMHVVGVGMEARMSAAANEPISLIEIEETITATDKGGKEWAEVLKKKEAKAAEKEAEARAKETAKTAAREAAAAARGPGICLVENRVHFIGPVKSLMRRKVHIINIGTTAIYYTWVRQPVNQTVPESLGVESMLTFGGAVKPSMQNSGVGVAPPRGARKGLQWVETSCFYLVNEDGVILPGEEFDFVFLFRSSRPGIFLEEWELQTNPRLKKPLPLVCLKGIALGEDVASVRRRDLIEELEKREKIHTVEETIDCLLDRVRTPTRARRRSSLMSLMLSIDVQRPSLTGDDSRRRSRLSLLVMNSRRPSLQMKEAARRKSAQFSTTTDRSLLEARGEEKTVGDAVQWADQSIAPTSGAAAAAAATGTDVSAEVDGATKEAQEVKETEKAQDTKEPKEGKDGAEGKEDPFKAWWEYEECSLYFIRVNVDMFPPVYYADDIYYEMSQIASEVQAIHTQRFEEQRLKEVQERERKAAEEKEKEAERKSSKKQKQNPTPIRLGTTSTPGEKSGKTAVVTPKAKGKKGAKGSKGPEESAKEDEEGEEDVAGLAGGILPTFAKTPGDSSRSTSAALETAGDPDQGRRKRSLVPQSLQRRSSTLRLLLQMDGFESEAILNRILRGEDIKQAFSPAPFDEGAEDGVWDACIPALMQGVKELSSTDNRGEELVKRLESLIEVAQIPLEQTSFRWSSMLRALRSAALHIPAIAEEVTEDIESGREEGVGVEAGGESKLTKNLSTGSSIMAPFLQVKNANKEVETSQQLAAVPGNGNGPPAMDVQLMDLMQLNAGLFNFGETDEKVRKEEYMNEVLGRFYRVLYDAIGEFEVNMDSSESIVGNILDTWAQEAEEIAEKDPKELEPMRWRVFALRRTKKALLSRQKSWVDYEPQSEGEEDDEADEDGEDQKEEEEEEEERNVEEDDQYPWSPDCQGGSVKAMEANGLLGVRGENEDKEDNNDNDDDEDDGEGDDDEEDDNDDDDDDEEDEGDEDEDEKQTEY
ncbi:hypothetical protein CBR_g23046 [Chara braunii]|uniref:Uncharacterized protein n=1 Tax=Chara braunii TaxID=69332 RepID=A0A388L3F5_CHABU|nr:hypothetical protein CBR_g23046 [Chara braunii]|eukprot:GBG76830.1 hypothetical protein CBR_g23046 [Chara braunii]